MGRGESWKRRTTRVRHDERTFFKTFPEYRVREAECRQREKVVYLGKDYGQNSTPFYQGPAQFLGRDVDLIFFWHN